MKVKVEENEGNPIFMRLYVCLKACKDNFISCRLIIDLEWLFTKMQVWMRVVNSCGKRW